MTVRELIKKLEKMPQGHTVLVDLHSEYTDQVQLALIEAYENGGYVSKAYRQEERLKAHGYIAISYRSE